MDRPPVSAVVCSHDRPELVQAALAGLAAGLADGDELVLVESGRPLGPAGLPAATTVLRPPHPAKCRKLNAAIESAKGEVLVLTDDDCEVDPGWVDAMAAPFASDPTVGVVFGPVRGLTTVGHAPLPTVPTGEAPLEPWLFAHGAAMAVRVQAARHAGGFDERMGPGTPTPGGEDHDLTLRVRERGWRVWLADAPPVRHRQWRGATEHQRNLLAYEQGAGVVLGAALRRRSPDSLRLLVRRLRYQRSLFGVAAGSEGARFGRLALGAFLGGLVRGLGRGPRRWLG